ncbi:MAG: hypothetical protein ACU0BS_07990 [Hasllibacter sp.]
MTAGTESVAGRRLAGGAVLGIAATCALTALMAGLSLLAGAMLIGLHEGDSVHLTAIVVRMAEGEWPHVDFSTPLGLLSGLPMAAALRAGAENWFVWGQALAGAAFLPAILWTAFGRFAPLPATLLATSLVIVMLSLTYGGSELSQSASMHYNRWGWAAMLTAFGCAVVAPSRPSQAADVADAVVIGGAILFLGLAKASYVAAVVPAVVAALAARRGWTALGGGVALGLAGCALVTLIAPPGFWAAYVADLLQVALSETRAWPGPGPIELVAKPAVLLQIALVLAAVIVMRRAGGALAAQGPALLLFAVGAVYATAQNWNNDTIWVWSLAPVLLGLGWDASGEAARRLALVATALAATEGAEIVNAAISPMRMLASDIDDYQPVIEGHPAGAGIRMVADRQGRVRLDLPWTARAPSVRSEAYEEIELPDGVDPAVGHADCKIASGWAEMFRSQAAELRERGHDGGPVFVADYMPAIWLFGAGPRLEGGAPWFYGLPPGFDGVELVSVPLCPASQEARDAVLEAMAAAGVRLREIDRTEIQAVYRVVR